MIIDFHTHIFPDAIAKSTVQKMAKNASIPLYSDGTLKGLLETMDTCRIGYSVTAPVATKPEQVESINIWTQANRHEKIIPLGAIHPDYPDIEKALADIKNSGIRGIKLHPDYQSFYPTEERMKPVYRACCELGLFILFHCGDDIGHPRPGHSLPRQMAAIVDEFPDQLFIFAHMGGFDMWDQAEKYLVGKNVYLDTSYSFGFISNERMSSIIHAHGPDRILVGSDSPWGSIGKNVEEVYALDMSEADRRNILGLNAARILGISA